MKRKHFFLIIIGFQVVFNFIPYSPERYDLFVWGDASVTYAEYIYYAFEHLAWVYISWLLAADARHPDKFITKTFFWLSVIDGIDFVLTYNTAWLTFSGSPISWNIIQVCVFLWAMIKDKGE